MFFSHVRAAAGPPIQQTSCHPFRFQNWLFMHNGALRYPPFGGVPESSEFTGCRVQIKLILSRGSIQRLGYLGADVAWARRVGTCTSHTENPAGSRLGDRPPKNPAGKRAGPALREFGSGLLHFLTGSAHVILSLPPSPSAQDPVMTAVLSLTAEAHRQGARDP